MKSDSNSIEKQGSASLVLGHSTICRQPVGFHSLASDFRHDSEGDLIRFHGAGHLATVAPTRSGKGVGTVIPNLLAYRGPVVVVDPKAEAYQATARRRREMGQLVIRSTRSISSIWPVPIWRATPNSLPSCWRRPANPRRNRFGTFTARRFIRD